MKTTIEDAIIHDFKEFSTGAGRRKEYMGDLIVAITRGLKDCSYLFIDSVTNFHMPPDPEYGIVKVVLKKSYYGEYKISIGDMSNFDTLIVIGLDKDKSAIKKVFAIPKNDLRGRKYITITSTTVSFQKFEIDEKPYARTYEDINGGKFQILDDGSIA